jgi:6-phosphogluconolactonase
MSADIRVLDDPAGAAADLLSRHAAAGDHIALTGGSTPAAAYERAATADISWGAATLWFGDDRCVPPEDELSNYGMAKRTLLDRIAGPPPTAYRMAGELGPDAGAADYEGHLREVFGQGTPSLHLVLLGLGPDGHCASLFPRRPELEETERLVVGVPEAGMEPYVPRVTLTLPVLNAAREVVFLVSGAGKADAVARAFEGEPDPAIPASLVAPSSGALTVLADPEAAAKLRRTSG